MDLVKKVEDERNVLIFDLGGGTFDVSVVNIEGELFEVKDTSGNTNLGGADFDNCLKDHFVKVLRWDQNKDISRNSQALRRLQIACEKAKEILSTTSETTIEIDSLHEGVDFKTTLTKDSFEEICHGLFETILKAVDDALQDARRSRSDINEVVVVGGSTRIPKLQSLLQEFMGQRELNKCMNPDEAVAYGAALQAAALTGLNDDLVGDLFLLDQSSISFERE